MELVIVRGMVIREATKAYLTEHQACIFRALAQSHQSFGLCLIFWTNVTNLLSRN